MKLQSSLLFVLIASLGLTMASGKAGPHGPHRAPAVPDHSQPASSENVISLADFGALGDGVSDDGPALQNALDALGAAGGGTLFVPAGRYAILTPVQKDFAGLASSVTILGVESLTPVPPPTSPGNVLTRGLDLVSEFAPRTGEHNVCLKISGLQSFTIKDITFIGTPGIINDALITLALNDIVDATIRHCEFYGLSSLVAGGSIVQAVRSNLTFEHSVVLGSTCASGVRSPVIQNLEWKGIVISDAVFVDYGQRAELFGKMNTAPYSWINIGNAAALDNDSPRREAVVRRVFLDEGGFFGVSSVPHLYSPNSAPIDLVYITGLYMNVSNFGTTGHHLDGLKGVLVEKSHYGWTHNADSAISLLSVSNAILDQVECVESADRIRATTQTGNLTVIDSVYNQLDSLAQSTRVITTSAPDEDPVQYVRQQFNATLGRDPDPAAHFYWSNQILQCGDNLQCTNGRRAALGNYLAAAPTEKFALSGQVFDETGAGMANVTVAIGGSQNLTTSTDSDGNYHFSKLPTSGSYTVSLSRRHYTLTPASLNIITPATDRIVNSIAIFNHHSIGGLVTDNSGNPMVDVNVTLSGAQSSTTTTDADGAYLFEDLPAGGNYTVKPQKTSYTFSATSQTFPDLDADQNLNFIGTFRAYSVGGIVVNINNYPLPGVSLKLSGSADRTTTTDGGGNFSFTGLPSEGNYTVTPMLFGHSLSPASLNYNSLAANQYQTYVASLTFNSINGRVTRSGGTGLSGATLILSGDVSRTTYTDAGGDYDFPNLPTSGNYSLTISKANCVFSEPTRTFNNLVSNQIADFTEIPAVFEFGAVSYSVSEGTKTITVTVTRSGITSTAVEVVYSATDISAEQGDDVIPVIGRLSFASNETSKTFNIFITDDSYVEGSESMRLELRDLVGGVLGNNSTATLTITDNDGGPTPSNPIDNAEFFVRQQYRDFLNRTPDDEGLAFWTNQILSCGNDLVCTADRRMNVSAAFFLSIEFQETGFLVYRLYQASFGRSPEHLNEFLLDSRIIGEGVVVNAPGWQELLESRKTAFIENFAMRSQFTEAYPLSLTPAEFVNLLNEKTGNALSPGDIAAAVAEFQGATTSDSYEARGRVLRRIAENSIFTQRNVNPAFVLMQYFGYLQRSPSESPDTNLDGYNFWLNKLNEFGGDFRRADMVKSFLVSGEYRERFGAH